MPLPRWKNKLPPPQTPYPADQGMHIKKEDQTFTKGTDILQEPFSGTL